MLDESLHSVPASTEDKGQLAVSETAFRAARMAGKTAAGLVTRGAAAVTGAVLGLAGGIAEGVAQETGKALSPVVHTGQGLLGNLHLKLQSRTQSLLEAFKRESQL